MDSLYLHIQRRDHVGSLPITAAQMPPGEMAHRSEPTRSSTLFHKRALPGPILSANWPAAREPIAAPIRAAETTTDPPLATAKCKSTATQSRQVFSTPRWYPAKRMMLMAQAVYMKASLKAAQINYGHDHFWPGTCKRIERQKSWALTKLKGAQERSKD